MRSPEPEPAEVPKKLNKRILVVEDEPLVREVISVYLSTDNHVTTAVNGVDGLPVPRRNRASRKPVNKITFLSG